MTRADEKIIANRVERCNLGIAYKCNFRCQMCFFWQNSPLSENNILNTEEWEEVFKEIKEFEINDDFILDFSGPGEIFLRKDIFSLISFAKSLNFKIQVISNGYLVNKILAQQISDAGLDYLCLSLDSLNPKTHDFLRGAQSATERVFQAINNIVQFSKKTKLGINTVISRINMPEIIELTKWVQENEYISHINFQAITQPFSFFDDPQENWFQKEEYNSLWPNEFDLMQQVINELIELKRQNYKIANSISQLEAFRSYFINPRIFIKEKRCNLGQGKVLNIDPAGNVSMCQIVGVIGNVKEGDTLRQIWLSEKANCHKKNIYNCRRNCHLVVSCYYEDERI